MSGASGPTSPRPDPQRPDPQRPDLSRLVSERLATARLESPRAETSGPQSPPAEPGWAGPTSELAPVRSRRAWPRAALLTTLALAAVVIGLGVLVVAQPRPAGVGPWSRDAAALPTGQPAQMPATLAAPSPGWAPLPTEAPSPDPMAADGPGPVLATIGAPLAGEATTYGFQYPTFANTGGLRFNGAARPVGDQILLSSGRESAGSVWSTGQIDPTRSFVTGFTAQISAFTDGIAFVVQSQSPTALGSSGGALGYGVRPGERARGITPSVAVELDAWDNRRDGFDPPGPHVAITTGGDIVNHLAWSSPGFPLAGDRPVDVAIVYDADRHLLSVFVNPQGVRPSEPLFAHGIDLAGVLGRSAYVGFTAGTGTTSFGDPWVRLHRWSYAQRP